MIRYGLAPPWEGRSRHYGSWKRGEEMWDGSGYAWSWVAPAASLIGFLGEMMRAHYVPVVVEQLNAETLLSFAGVSA